VIGRYGEVIKRGRREDSFVKYWQIQRCVQRVKVRGIRIVHSREEGFQPEIGGSGKRGVIKLYQRRYKGFGPTLASEKLLEREGLEVSDETLRQWLLESGIEESS